MLPSEPLELRFLVIDDGSEPFAAWFDRLDTLAAAKVTIALVRLGQGNLSRAKSVGEGVLEYRIDWGPGYRIYFGRDEAAPAGGYRTGAAPLGRLPAARTGPGGNRWH